MTEADLDALGLLGKKQRFLVRFGPAEVGTALKDGSINRAANLKSDVNVELDLGRATATPDYFAGIAVGVEEGAQYDPQFTGVVVSATLTPDGVVVTGHGARALLENKISGFGAHRLQNFELIYSIARTGGLRDDQLDIEGMDALPREIFEVVTPLDGIELDQAATFGGVRFLPQRAGIRAFARFDIHDRMKVDYEAAAYALAYVTSARTLAAEEEGLAQIDLSLAWLTVRLRYGFATLPDGRPLSFSRSDSLTRVARRNVAMVRGVSTKRQWLRRTDTIRTERAVRLAAGSARLQPAMPSLNLQEQLAFLALTRAAHENDPLAAVQALFEAIEFYVSGVSAAEMFTKSERRQLRTSLPSSLTEQQFKRVCDLLSGLNNAPLRTRLMRALKDDRVPVLDGELDLLWRLRALRNDVVHGRSSEPPAAEDVEYATSIVARFLTYRAAIKSSRPRP